MKPTDSPQHNLVCSHCSRITYHQDQFKADEAEASPTWHCPYCGQGDATWQRNQLSDTQHKLLYYHQEIERRKREIKQLVRAIIYTKKTEKLQK